MKKETVILLGILLSACSSEPDRSYYYMLPANLNYSCEKQAAQACNSCGSSPHPKEYDIGFGSCDRPKKNLGAAEYKQEASFERPLQAISYKPVLWIESVEVPEHLGKYGIVYQTDDVRYVMARSNAWILPLEQQLQQLLGDKLGAILPEWKVVPTFSLEDDLQTSRRAKLNVAVREFHGRYDGYAVVSGLWTLKLNGQWSTYNFHHEVPLEQDGYESLVKSLAKGWQDEVNRIADVIREKDI